MYKLLVLFTFIVLSHYSILAQTEFKSLGWNGDISVSHAFGVSGDGNVVVGQSQGIPFRWTSLEGMIGLGSDFGSAISINSDGSIITGQLNNSEAFIYKKNTFTKLNFNNEGISKSYISDISLDGSVMVGYVVIQDTIKAFYWSQDKINYLDHLSNDNKYTKAIATSGNGEKIVGTSLGKAFLWDKTNGIRPIGALSDFGSFALDISSDGNTVVGFSTIERVSERQYIDASFRWTEAEGMKNLGFIHSQSKYSCATAVSQNGEIIVGKEITQSGETIGFIWTIEEGIQSLSDYLFNQYNIDLTSWTLEPQDISLDGKSIVGYGVNPEGNEEAWLINLSTQPTFIHESSEVKSNKNSFSIESYPNPFNPSTTIAYTIPSTNFVEICIYDLLGNVIVTLESEIKTSGKHKVTFNGSSFPSGIYLCQLKLNSQILTKKLLLLK